MKNSLRHIIREQLEKLFEADGGALDDALADIEGQLTDTQEYLDNLEKETEQEIKTNDKLLNTDKQAKSSSPTTIDVGGTSIPNPKRKALDAQIPAQDKLNQARKKELDKIRKAQDAFKQAKDDLEKQKLDLAKSEGGKSEQSTLSSLDSPI